MVVADTVLPQLPVYVRVSEILLAADDANLDAAIDEALGALGGAVGVDRAYVFLIRDGVLDKTHAWTDAGIRPETERLQALPVKVMDAFARGEPIHIASVTELPPSWSEFRAILEAQDIRSVVIAPLMRDGVLVGFVGFDSVLAKRPFQEQEIAVLRATANLIVAALGRRTSIPSVGRG